MTRKSRKTKITPVNSCCIVCAGRTPRDSGPHSFNKEWQMLQITHLLISEVLERRLSISMSATLERSSAGHLFTSVNR